jgi:GntR family transcriptional regulator
MQRLQPDAPTPLYYQLELALRQAIKSRQFPNGRLPTEDGLARQYQVSRLTVRTALRRLEDDGLIERRPARGTFVCPEALEKLVRDHGKLGFEEDLRRHGGTPTIEVLSYEQVECPASVATSLGLAATEPVYLARRLGRIDGEPLWLERRYFPLDIGAKLTERDIADLSAGQHLQQVLGVHFASNNMRIDARAATTREARLLSVDKAHPLLVSQVTSYDAAGRALQLMQAAFRGDRYAINLSLPPRADGGQDERARDNTDTGFVDRLVRWELVGVG